MYKSWLLGLKNSLKSDLLSQINLVVLAKSPVNSYAQLEMGHMDRIFHKGGQE